MTYSPFCQNSMSYKFNLFNPSNNLCENAGPCQPYHPARCWSTMNSSEILQCVIESMYWTDLPRGKLQYILPNVPYCNYQDLVHNGYESSQLFSLLIRCKRSLMGRWMIGSPNPSMIPYLLKLRISIEFYKHFWALCSSLDMSVGLLLVNFGIVLVQNREYHHWFTFHWTTILAIWFMVSIH